MNDSERKAMFAKFSKNQKNLLIKLSGDKPVLSKNEMQLIKNGLNGSSGGELTREFANKARNLIAEKANGDDMGVAIDSTYTQQGLDWLRKPAIQKQLGGREKDAVENFKEYKLNGFRDVRHGNGIPFYEPVYTVFGENTDFDYNYHQGKVDISG